VGRGEDCCGKSRKCECYLLQLDEISGDVAATTSGVRQYTSTSMLGRVSTQHIPSAEQAHVPTCAVYAMVQATAGYFSGIIKKEASFYVPAWAAKTDRQHPEDIYS
jgi:hypothetical protein